MGRESLAPDEGMFFRPAGSIHMFFMRFAIDAVFCDRDLQVVKIERELKPWRTAGARGAKVVVELAAGAAAGVEPGDRLVLEERKKSSAQPLSPRMGAVQSAAGAFAPARSRLDVAPLLAVAAPLALLAVALVVISPGLVVQDSWLALV